MKIGIVRGAFLNQSEMQNFEPLCARHEVVGFSSLKPLHDKFPFPVVKLPSPMDLPAFPNSKIKMGFLNRLFIDAHYLLGLEERLRGFGIACCAETYYHYTQQCLNAKKKGHVKKVVATVWENIAFNNEGIRGRKSYKQRAINEVDHFLAVTEGAKKALVKEGCLEQKISVIPMGINIKKFTTNPSVGERERNLEVLFVGRLEKEKGIVELLEAFKLLNINYKKNNLRLRIIGKGSLHDYIVRRGEEWGITSKLRIEEKSYREMPKVYEMANIVVLPSKPTEFWQEQFGMVLLEAMASGLPIVATKSGAIPEVVGEAGILVSPADVQALYKGLSKVIENPLLRKQLGEKARKRVESYFDAPKIARKIENIYLKLLQ